MTQFVTTFFIVLGAYLFCLLAFSVVKFIFKRKDLKKGKKYLAQREKDILDNALNEEDIKDDD